MREDAAVDLLLTFALDLLAQTERQQRALTHAQAELVEYACEARSAAARPERRQHCIDTVTSAVTELSTVITEQSALLTDMRETVRSLRGRS
jgi:hypothetical protein